MADNRKIRDFVERWTGRGYEKGEAVSFWKDLLYALGYKRLFIIEGVVGV